MNKCEDCYWKFKKSDVWCARFEREQENCKEFNAKCTECAYAMAEYEYQGAKLCSGCVIKAFKVDEYTTTYYYRDGECLGSDDDLGEVIESLDEDIKKLEDE